mgnify:CR=1 FL=1
MQSGLFRGDLRAKINRGQIEVLPELDFSRTGRTLVLRDPAKLISNMELTQEIADSFLGLIHPLFKGTSVIGGGRFHMSMDHFRWPLDPEMKNDASFKGVMKFHDLQLGVSGLLEQLLAAIKVPAHWEIHSEPLPRNAAGKILKNVLTGEATKTQIDE